MQDSTVSTERKDNMRRFCIEAAFDCQDLKCRDVKVLDVRGLSPVCDYLLMATAASTRQMSSVANSLIEIGQKYDLPPMSPHKRGDMGNRWLALDLIDVIVHLFDEEARMYYDLDGLWGDAKEVKWFEEERPTDAKTSGD